jgi:hypothetical protein
LEPRFECCHTDLSTSVIQGHHRPICLQEQPDSSFPIRRMGLPFIRSGGGLSLFGFEAGKRNGSVQCVDNIPYRRPWRGIVKVYQGNRKPSRYTRLYGAAS